jgi:hypothetical protein
VKLKEPTTYKNYHPATPLRPSTTKSEDETQQKYTNLVMTDSPNDSAARNNTGKLELSFEEEPDNQAEHILELLMNGNSVKALTESGSVVLGKVDRRTHVLKVPISNAKNVATLAFGLTTTITVPIESTTYQPGQKHR